MMIMTQREVGTHPPREKYFVEKIQDYEVSIRIRYDDQNEIGLICEWLDQHVSSQWSSRIFIKDTFVNGTVTYSVSFNDLPTATLFRLRF